MAEPKSVEDMTMKGLIVEIVKHKGFHLRSYTYRGCDQKMLIDPTGECISHTHSRKVTDAAPIVVDDDNLYYKLSIHYDDWWESADAAHELLKEMNESNADLTGRTWHIDWTLCWCPFMKVWACGYDSRQRNDGKGTQEYWNGETAPLAIARAYVAKAKGEKGE